MNIKEALDRQTMQNFTFPCCIFPLTRDIHLDKKIDISCALIQRDLWQEDVIKLVCLCQLSGTSVRHDLDHDTFKCCLRWLTHANLKWSYSWSYWDSLATRRICRNCSSWILLQMRPWTNSHPRNWQFDNLFESVGLHLAAYTSSQKIA